MSERDEESKKGFVVNDRRQFAADGSSRQEAEHPVDSPGQAATDDGTLPEIDFSTFLLSLASSAFYHLGEMPHPDTAKTAVNLPLAKQTIDILGILNDKTRGNLSADEQKLLDTLLYDLRLKYVEATKA